MKANRIHSTISALLAVLLLHPVGSPAQDTSRNYVRTVTMLDAGGTDSLVSVQYYDLLGHPVRIQFTGGSVTRYVYSAAGEKLRVIHQTAVPNVTVPVGSVRELSPSEVLSSDSTDWLLGGSLTLRNGSIDKYHFGEGYCQASRLAGKTGSDSGTNSDFQGLRYGGKELERAAGIDWYDFGARWLDPARGCRNS